MYRRTRQQRRRSPRISSLLATARTRKGLFRPVRNRRTGDLEKAITGGGVYKMVKDYAKKAALRATAATNALEHEADIGFVQRVARARQHLDH